MQSLASIGPPSSNTHRANVLLYKYGVVPCVELELREAARVIIPKTYKHTHIIH